MRKIISIVLSFGLLFQQSGLLYAAGEINLANYLSQARSAIVQPDQFRPAQLSYISYDMQTNDFKLLLDKGDVFNQKTEKPKNEKTLEFLNSLNSSTPKLNDATQELFKYFLIGLALPNDTFWVNLRPDAPENIIDPLLEKTDIGKIFLEADLQLKKDTASLTSPQNPEGKSYWDKLYKKAGELFGTENITIPTITRPWIVPNEVIVRETEDSAYIYKATLKVMLEADYLQNQKTEKPENQKTEGYNFSDPRLKELNEYSSQIIRETIIPKLTKEINSSKRYAKLRQVYYSLVLARWFKQKYSSLGSISAPEPQSASSLANSYLSLIDSRNLVNLVSKEPCDKQSYFQAYQKSFKDGEYNLKETVATPFGQSIRSYISGGLGMEFPYKTVNSPVTGIKVNSSPVTNILTEQPPATTASPLMTKEEFLSRINLIQKEVLKSLGKGNSDYYYEGGIEENDNYFIFKVWTNKKKFKQIRFRSIDNGNIIEISANLLSPGQFVLLIIPAINTILPGIEYPVGQDVIRIKYDDYKNLTTEGISKFNQRDPYAVIHSAFNMVLPKVEIKAMQDAIKKVLRTILIDANINNEFRQINELLTMLRVTIARTRDSGENKLLSSKQTQEKYSDLYILNNVFERMKRFVFIDGKRINDVIWTFDVAKAIQKEFNEYCDGIVSKLRNDSLLERAQKDNLRGIEENRITADKAGELIRIIDWLLEKIKEKEGDEPIYQIYKDNLLFIQEVTSPRAAGSPLTLEESKEFFKNKVEAIVKEYDSLKQGEYTFMLQYVKKSSELKELVEKFIIDSEKAFRKEEKAQVKKGLEEIINSLKDLAASLNLNILAEELNGIYEHIAVSGELKGLVARSKNSDIDKQPVHINKNIAYGVSCIKDGSFYMLSLEKIANADKIVDIKISIDSVNPQWGTKALKDLSIVQVKQLSLGIKKIFGMPSVIFTEQLSALWKSFDMYGIETYLKAHHYGISEIVDDIDKIRRECYQRKSEISTLDELKHLTDKIIGQFDAIGNRYPKFQHIIIAKTMGLRDYRDSIDAQLLSEASSSSAVVVAKKTATPQQVGHFGGIDLTDRMLHIRLERVGSFASSALVLPEIDNVEALDLDKEFEQIQAMVSSSIRPSDTRILEFATACYYKGEFDQRLEQVSSCVKAAHLADERLGRDSSDTLRLATMLPDALYGGRI